MIKITPIVETLTQKLSEAIPPQMKTLNEEIGQRFREILQAQLAKLDLVTREEFEVQVKLLSRARERIEALEKQIEALQKNPAKTED